MTRLFIFMSVIFLGGCSLELQDKEQGSSKVGSKVRFKTKTFKSESVPMKSEFFEIIPGDLPNSYSVKLFPSADVQVILRNELDADSKGSSNSSKTRVVGSWDQQVQAGKTYRYQFQAALSQQSVDSQRAATSQQTVNQQLVSFQVQIPEDFVVTGKVKIENLPQSIHRLYFTENSELITQGQDLEISVAEIHSAGLAKILAFDQQAAFGSSGKNAGHLSLSVQFISGNLEINYSGQAGGSGQTGESFAIPAKAGVSFPSESFVSDCSTLKAGGRGMDGLPGKDGGPGFVGGDGGSVQIETPEEFKNQIQILVRGGSGGLGGAGGLGQSGGAAGKSQTGLLTRVSSRGELQTEACPIPASEGPGTTGPSGRTGVSGPTGKDGTILWL